MQLQAHLFLTACLELLSPGGGHPDRSPPCLLLACRAPQTCLTSPISLPSVHACLQAWSCDGLVLWRPVPPTDHVSLGCVAGMGPVPPPLTLVGCLHVRATVPARPGECVLMSANGHLWGVRNAGCTTQAARPYVHLPEVRACDGDEMCWVSGLLCADGAR